MIKSVGKNQINRKKFEEIFKKHGYKDYKWINPRQIVVAQWARMKCTFGCKNYGKCGTCPPNTPSVAEVKEFVREYKTCAVFRFTRKVPRPEDRFAWTRKVNSKLLKLERDIFLSGCYKAFLLFMDSCHLCSSCTGIKQLCKQPMMSRPSPESMAIDVFATVQKINFPIEVLYDYKQEMNRYAFLFIE